MLSNGVTVEGYVQASPTAVFDLLADPSRHRDLDGSGTLRGAMEGSSRLSLGARFGMNMKAGASYTLSLIHI